jgi:hypothetical protein
MTFAWYKQYVPWLTEPQLAFLGANDRFWLVTFRKEPVLSIILMP